MSGDEVGVEFVGWVGDDGDGDSEVGRDRDRDSAGVVVGAPSLLPDDP